MSQPPRASGFASPGTNRHSDHLKSYFAKHKASNAVSRPSSNPAEQSLLSHSSGHHHAISGVGTGSRREASPRTPRPRHYRATVTTTTSATTSFSSSPAAATTPRHLPPSSGKSSPMPRMTKASAARLAAVQRTREVVVPSVDGVPSDVLLLVMKRLSAAQLLVSAQVCRSWARVAGDSSLWQNLYRRRWPKCDDIVEVRRMGEQMDWRRRYIERAMMLRAKWLMRLEKSHKSPYTTLSRMDRVLPTMRARWYLRATAADGSEQLFPADKVAYHAMSATVTFHTCVANGRLDKGWNKLALVVSTVVFSDDAAGGNGAASAGGRGGACRRSPYAAVASPRGRVPGKPGTGRGGKRRGSAARATAAPKRRLARSQAVLAVMDAPARAILAPRIGAAASAFSTTATCLENSGGGPKRNIEIRSPPDDEAGPIRIGCWLNSDRSASAAPLEPAFVVADIHYHRLLERVARGNRRQVADIAPPPPRFDDIDPRYGLHHYMCTLEIRTQDGGAAPLFGEQYRDLDAVPGFVTDTCGRRCVRLDVGGRMGKFIDGALELPWRAGVLSGTMADTLFVDVTLCDEHGACLWALSAPVYLHASATRATDYAFSEGRTLACEASDARASVRLEVVEEEPGVRSCIREAAVFLSVEALNGWFGTQY